MKENEKQLRDFYKRLLNFTIQSPALMGEYQEIHYYNKEHTDSYDHRIFSFTRWDNDERLIVISNFDTEKSYDIDFKLPPEMVAKWQLKVEDHVLKEQLYGLVNPTMKIVDGVGIIHLNIQPLESFVFSLK